MYIPYLKPTQLTIPCKTNGSLLLSEASFKYIVIKDCPLLIRNNLNFQIVAMPDFCYYITFCSCFVVNNVNNSRYALQIS